MPNIIEQILFRIGGDRLRVALARKWGVRVGKRCYFHPPCRFGRAAYLISIGNDCALAGDNTFFTYDGGKRIFEDTKADKDIGQIFGPIVIRDNCMIGYRVIILPNVIIGPNSVVGAGSVVTKNVPPNTVYAGNPAKLISTYDEYLEKCNIRSTGNIPRKLRKQKLNEMFKEI